jgi:hypothetical protein
MDDLLKLAGQTGCGILERYREILGIEVTSSEDGRDGWGRKPAAET